MKKLISIVLTICMLFSMISVVSAADISEDERLALLSEKDYTYIDINPNIDAFASSEVIRDYAVFETASDTTSAYNALHEENGYSYRTRIPTYTHSGVAVDGTESYYKKGIGYFNIDDVRIYSTQNHAPAMFVTESYKLTADELQNVKNKYFKNIAKATTSKMVAADPAKYTVGTFAFPNKDNGYDFMPLIEDIEYKGDNFSVILKDNNSNAKIKVGPMNDKEFVKNAVDYIGAGSTLNHIVTLPEGVKGDSIAIAATVGNVNNGGSVEGISISPGAAFLPIQIKYADGEIETKQMVITSLANANDMVSSAIVYGDKYDGGREIDYKTETSYYSQLQFMEKGTGLTFADVTFPENVSAGDINFGFALRASQSDNYTDFSNQVNLGTFDLKDKEISTIKFVNDQAPGDNDVDGIISLKSNNVRALVPVEIKNGDADKVYFLYLGRITQQPAVFGATVINKSLQEKIDAINAKLELVDENTTEADCEVIDKEITALKAESELVEDKDFNQEKYTFIKDKLLALAQRKIKAVEAAIEGLADVYTYSIKESVVSVYADYVFLLENGIKENEVDAELTSKIKALYASYEKANALETLVAGWEEYSYSMYNDVLKTSEDLEEMSEMVAEKTAEKVASYFEVATAAKAIDEKIAALSDAYEEEMLEEVLAIEDEVNKFIANGGSEDAFENIEKLKSLIESAASDVLNADIEEVVKLIAELPKSYSTSIKAQVDEIVEAIESIEARDGQISSEAKAKLDKILAQKNEEALYVTNKLNYTRDVFEDVKAYAAQGYADRDKGVYVYPADAWSVAVSSVAGATKMALDEAGFVTYLNLDGKNVGTTAGIPYQYGPVVSKVHGIVNEPNSINASDCSNVIKIDVEELPYEELYLAAWAKVNNTSVVITYNYADGTSSTEQNLKGILGGYSSKPKNNDYATMMNSTGVPYWRAYSSTANNDQIYGYGGYSIYVSSHRLTPDDTKVLKSVEIAVSDQDVNVFALTGKVSNSGIVSEMLDEAVAGFEGEKTADEIRGLVKASNKFIEILDAKEVAYNDTYAATIQQYGEKYISVKSVDCYTDLDNRNITVTFSGTVAEDSITKNNFLLKKDGEAVSNYNIEKVAANVIKITVKNAFDYESDYSLEISKDIYNAEKTVALGTTEVYDYDGLAAVDVKVAYENNKISISLKNNLLENLDSFVVMVGAYDNNNALVKFEPVSGSIEAGAEFNQTIDFNTDAAKISCDVITSLDIAKFIFDRIEIK